MPVTKGDVRIHYETRGSRDGVPLLFIQGFTWPLVGWREGFCQEFVDRGALVVLFDNRDVGLSQKFGGPTDMDGGYSLADMAGDGFAVLDDLGLDGAHLVGASMGGMIAQAMALSQPSRVRSLNLIYAPPSLDKRYIVPHEQDYLAMAMRRDRAGAIEEFVERDRLSASTAYRYDAQWVRELAARDHDRCYAPDGRIRQLYAMSRWSPVPDALSTLDMPASIIHGRADNRIHVDAALDLGQLLKNSELHVYSGLGHEIPAPLWPEFATVIMRTAARA